MSNTITLPHPPTSISSLSPHRRHPHDLHLAHKRKKILSKKLQQVFQLPEDEDLLAEYSSWLFRSVLLKGYVYLTTAHVCFYAFLSNDLVSNHPDRDLDEDGEQVKSGFLSRRHPRKLHQRRIVKSWFILKDSILSWYPSSHQPYFPTGQIDLHFCTKLESASPDSKHPTQFKLFVSGKVYTFLSDTQQTKDQWVKALRQTIFNCQHHGQNVKIAIPLTAIESVERCDSVQFAQTICLKIKDHVTAQPFVHHPNLSNLTSRELDDVSLKDYFFGFLQDSQTPYDSIRAALDHVRSNHQHHHISLPPTVAPLLSPSIDRSSSPSPSHPTIRDSTRFSTPNAPPHHHVPGSPEDRFGNLTSASSQPPSASIHPPELSSMPHTPPILTSDERKSSGSSLTHRIGRLASSGNKFVGCPIRTASKIVKVHTPTTCHTIGSGSGSLPVVPTTPGSVSPEVSVSPSSSSLQGDTSASDDSSKRSHAPLRDRSISDQANPQLAQSHTYPPHHHRPSEYSTWCQRAKTLDQSNPQASSAPNMSISPPHELSPIDHTKTWNLLPAWLKSVPTTPNPIKPAKEILSSARGLVSCSTDPSFSPPIGPIREQPSSSTRVSTPEKSIDEEDLGRFDYETQLTPKDQAKFQTEFNFLSSGTISNSVHPEGSMRLLLKTRCNLLRAGSSIYGQIYLAIPIQLDSPKQKNLRKSCVCFKGQKRISSTPVKMILPVEVLTAIGSEGSFLSLGIRPNDVFLESEEVCFEFGCEEQVKAVHDELLRMMQDSQDLIPALDEDEDESRMIFTHDDRRDAEPEEEDGEGSSSLPIMFQSSSSSFLTFKPKTKLHITCLTIGSRGDVQPYIALCQKLQLDGHTCRIASHAEYRSWVEGFGIEYVEIGGDPAELMKICVDNGMFTLGFLKEAFLKFRGWLDELLVSSYEACKGTDLLIESPSTMAGIHIAEALEIPYYRAFTMPWTRTKEYPHAFAVPDRKMGSSYNYMTYTLFDQVFWKAMSGQVNKWRKEKLGLKSTTYEKLEVHKVPFLYNFSSTIVPTPLDWFEWVHITGYWFIDEDDPNKLPQPQATSNNDLTSTTHPTDAPATSVDQNTITSKSNSLCTVKTPPKSSWEPSPELVSFLDQAKSQNKKVVYIGFGSIVVPDPEATTKVIIDSVKSAGVYAILSKGWSERLSTTTTGVNKSTLVKGPTDGSSTDSRTTQVEASEAGKGKTREGDPEDLSMIFFLNSIPHDWLFPRIDAVCHHGGAGTTGASLRAGIPTIIKPFFGDQFFWAERVETLGIGASVRKLTVKNLTQALLNATTNQVQIKRAQLVGEQIRSESGTARAVECIYRDLEYAKSLIKRRPKPAEVNGNPSVLPRTYSAYRPKSSSRNKNRKLNPPSSTSTQSSSSSPSSSPSTKNSPLVSQVVSIGDSHSSLKLDESSIEQINHLDGSTVIILSSDHHEGLDSQGYPPRRRSTKPSDGAIRPVNLAKQVKTEDRNDDDESSTLNQAHPNHNKTLSESVDRDRSRVDRVDGEMDDKVKSVVVGDHSDQDDKGTIIVTKGKKYHPLVEAGQKASANQSHTSDEDSSSWDILSQQSKSDAPPQPLQTQGS